MIDTTCPICQSQGAKRKARTLSDGVTTSTSYQCDEHGYYTVRTKAEAEAEAVIGDGSEADQAFARGLEELASGGLAVSLTRAQRRQAGRRFRRNAATGRVLRTANLVDPNRAARRAKTPRHQRRLPAVVEHRGRTTLVVWG